MAYTAGDGKSSTTTGDIATFIESEYHVMRTFLELYEGDISQLLADEITGAIESIAQGKPVTRLSFGVGTDRIAEKFRDYLDAREWKQTSGQAVAAADRGDNVRKKARKQDNGRAEFIDSGLYQASFRAWVD
ncbi:hypothetical protein AWB78_01335 [Caballeronia calidae]|uniref:Uncharacterized protein n=1 Tax=Caballeronia calidae TaxID=1777139 RepID=A0A158A6Y7_9BURK|nr:hypothetical protein [Caballeronia calidae]SAK53533.1 hypothetical protein AWB78_01335 [Caballeronia calidae]